MEHLVWPSFGAFPLITSLLSPFVFGKGEQTSCDKSFVYAGFTFFGVVVVYLTYRLLSLDKEYLRCTVKGFYYKPNPKKPSHFYAWADVEEFSFSRIRGKYRDSYRIEVYFKNKDNVKSQSLLALLKRRCCPFHQSADLIIPIFLLDVGLPERVYETMKYYEREWRIEQNRQARKQTKQALKSKSSKQL